jgi:hypothetical protein
MNALNQDVQGKIVQTKHFGRVLCVDGFGCHSFTSGTAIMAKVLETGREIRISGFDIGGPIENPPEAKP